MSEDNSTASDEIKKELLKLRFQTEFAGAVDGTKYVIDYALLGLRGLLIVNGGALIGLVTFLGHDGPHTTGAGLWIAYTGFVLGLVSAFLSILFSYVAQWNFSWEEALDVQGRYFAECGDQTQGDQHVLAASEYRSTGSKWQFAAIAFAVLSILFFAGGAFAALSALISS